MENYRPYTFKPKKGDEEILKFLERQDNVTDSIRYLIQKEIYENGIRNLQLIIPNKRSDVYFSSITTKSHQNIDSTLLEISKALETSKSLLNNTTVNNTTEEQMEEKNTIEEDKVVEEQKAEEQKEQIKQQEVQKTSNTGNDIPECYL